MQIYPEFPILRYIKLFNELLVQCLSLALVSVLAHWWLNNSNDSYAFLNLAKKLPGFLKLDFF